MKTLTKLFTTVLTIGLLANTAQANREICDLHSENITDAYTSTAKIVEGGLLDNEGRLLDKSEAIDLLRTTSTKHFKSQFKGRQLRAVLIMNNYALDYVDKNYEKMKLMTNAEIKNIGYYTCVDIEGIVLELYYLN